MPIFIDSEDEDDDLDIVPPVARVKEETSKDIRQHSRHSGASRGESSPLDKSQGSDRLEAKEALRVALSKLDTEVNLMLLYPLWRSQLTLDQIGGRPN